MKIFEIILYIALMAFVFSGYVIFAGDFAKFSGNAILHKKILIENYLSAEYLRWSIYNKFDYYLDSKNNSLLNNSTSTILDNLSKIKSKKVENLNYLIVPNVLDKNRNQSVQFHLDYKNDKRTFNVLLP